MAGRRGQKADIKAGLDTSVMVYVSMAVVLVVLVLTIYTFGIDFGFVHIGGTMNLNVLYGGAALSILFSYIVDVMYIKAIRKYYRAKPTYLTYLPYINFIAILPRKVKYVCWVLLGIAILIMVPVFTPLGQFMPVNYIVFMSVQSLYIVFGLAVIYTLIRGYYSFYFKKQAELTYKREISEEYGAGGGITTVGYIIYFLPIIRAISLFTDLNYINTVKAELDDMYKEEER